MAVSCKNMNPEQRLYNNVKSRFVENAEPRLLRHYLELTLADEERVIEEIERNGRPEGASLLLRLIAQRPGGFDQLQRALRNPQVDQTDLADYIQCHMGSVLAVVDVDVEMVDEEGKGEEEEDMDVDFGVDADSSGPSEPVSKQTHLDNLKRLVDTHLKDLPNDKTYMTKIGEILKEIAGVLLAGASYGCLELLLQVKSISALYRLRKLYQGGALCDALSRVILTKDFKQQLHREAAKMACKVKKLCVSVKISQDDFLECYHFLASVDLPPPIGYLEVRSEPVDPFGEPKYPSLQDHLKSLPTTYQQFLRSVAELTDQPSEKSALTLAAKSVCEMVKESMDSLHTFFKLDEELKEHLLKIGLVILCKSVLNKMRNVNVVTLDTGVGEIVETGEEEALRKSLCSEESMGINLSTSVDRLVVKGWLVKHGAEGQNVKYAFPGPLRRDYVVCYILPTVLKGLDINLFLDRDGDAEKFSDLWWFPFASIILPYVACYKGLEKQFPKTALYFPNVALFLSSVHANVKAKEVREKLVVLMKPFDFQSFLNIQISPDVDRHWKTWKAVAANLGIEKINMVNRSADLDEDSFNNKISVIENSLQISHGNVIALKPMAQTSDVQLALRSASLLDLLPSVLVDLVPPEGPKRSESTLLETAPTSPPTSPSTAGESPTATGTASHAGAYDDTHQLSLPSEGAAEIDDVEMRLRRSLSHETAQRFSGSDVEVDLLQKEGRLTLDSKKVKGDYRLRKASDWSFTLDLSAVDLTMQDVSVLCRFLPQMNHVTSFHFGGSALDNAMVKKIVKFLNPDTVQNLSFLRCPLNLKTGKIGLEKFRKLEFLDLEDTGIDDRTCPIVVEEIEHLNNLREINLGCNTITSHGFTIISSALVSKFNLRALRLHSINLGAKGASVLAQLVFSLRHLEILSLWGCRLGDEGISTIAEMFPVHRRLKRLSVRDNNISSIGSETMYKNLASCPTLQFIDHNECGKLQGQNAEQISENILSMFKASSSWDHVSLFDCSVGYLTVFSDSANLTNLANVTYVCLQKNFINDDSFMTLAECIDKHFSYLQHLNLRDNQMGDRGAEAIARGLVGKNHLEDLWLDWNMFSHSGAKALIETIQDLPKLKCADLSYSFQLAPPERDDLVRLIGDPVRDGDLYRAQKDQLTLTI